MWPEEAMRRSGRFPRWSKVKGSGLVITHLADQGKGVRSCNYTFGGSISLSPCRAFHVIVHVNHAWLPAGYAVRWSGLVAWASARAVTVGFKAPLHLGRIPVIEDDLCRHRQSEGALNTL